MNPNNSIVLCPDFTQLVKFPAIGTSSKMFSIVLNFRNVTFNGFKSLYKIHNLTVDTDEDGRVAVSDAWISCREVFVRLYHAAPKFFLLNEHVTLNVEEPRVRVTVKYHLTRNEVELVRATFNPVDESMTGSYFFTMTDKYDYLALRITDILFDHFLKYKSRVDDALFDRFQTAIELSGVANVLNMTVRRTSVS